MSRTKSAVNPDSRIDDVLAWVVVMAAFTAGLALVGTTLAVVAVRDALGKGDE